MEQLQLVWNWLGNNSDTIVAVLAILAGMDGVAGAVPNKLVPYVGMFQRIFKVIKKKKGGTVLSVALLAMLVGCATTGTQQLAAAKIIARNAGYYIAANNPEVSTKIISEYQNIEKTQAQIYTFKVTDGIRWMLDQRNVKGSEKLAQDAADLLSIFGVPVPDPKAITPDWLGSFDQETVRTIAAAFVEGLHSK